MSGLVQADARYDPLASNSVHCVVTSPPFWGLRDYGLPPSVWDDTGDCPGHVWGTRERSRNAGVRHGKGASTLTGGRQTYETILAHYTTAQGTCQRCGAWRGCLGMEPTPNLYVQHLVQIFREVRRVLRDEGTLWLNLGDSYVTHEGGRKASQRHGYRNTIALPKKNLLGIPWRVALALQADGWILRSAAPWVKRSAMPESVQDRPASSLEYLFLLAKQPTYYFDMDAVRQPYRRQPQRWGTPQGPWNGQYAMDARHEPRRARETPATDGNPRGRARRNSDWWFESVGMLLADAGEILGYDVPPQGYSGAHYACFPEALVTPCVLSGTSAYGCCAQCGAPWQRVVERTPPPHYSGGKAAGLRSTGMADHRSAFGPSGNGLGVQPVTTTGWRADCAHDAPVVPSIVLDPFCGSGTVLKVAQKHGRVGGGLDLSLAYLKQSQGRLGYKLPNMLVKSDGQLGLFSLNTV